MENRSPNTANAVGDIRDLLGDRCSTSPYDIESHARDESFHPPAPPDAVAFPESNEEVAAVVGICARHRVPIVPFGAGTAVEGHVQATHGGISLDLALVRQNLGKRSALGLFAESTVAGNTPLFVERMLCIRYLFFLLLYYELSSSM